jgi:hypothetical protein
MKLCTFALAFLSLPVFSATTAVLNLKGTVAQILEISITPETLATTLPLTQSQSAVKIATVTERSNSHTGYKVQITSLNLGQLKGSNGNDVLPYSLTYNNNAVNLTSATGQTFSYSFTNAAPVDRNVGITYTGSSSLPSGDYVDAVTFTISAN